MVETFEDGGGFVRPGGLHWSRRLLRKTIHLLSYYLVLSSHSDLDYLGALIGRAGFHARLVAKRWILIESLFIYELQAPRSFLIAPS